MRRVGVALALLLVLALVASLAFALYGNWRTKRATERFEAVLGPPDLARFIRSEVPEADNAATWLAAGAGAIVLSGDQREFMGPRERAGAPWSAGEIALASRIVEDNAPALELLRRAAACKASSYSLDYLQGPDIELPPILELLRAGSVLWIDARLALAAGDVSRLRTDLETLDRLADSLARESLLVTAIVAQAIDRYYLDLVHRLVIGGSEPQDLLADVEAVLAGRDRQADYLRSLAAEGSLLFSLPAVKVPVADGVRPPNWLTVQLYRLAGPLLTAALVDEFSAIGELVAKPWPEVVATSQERLERGFPRSFAVTLYPNLIDSIGKLKAGESARQLALEAIRQRRALMTDGAYRPAGEVPLIDPYSGRQVRAEHRSDGMLVLEAPGALELWRDSHSGGGRIGDPHFTWELPATP
jgi:hypothetical protein